MAKLKAPKWGGNYERYKKLLLIWLRTLESTRTDEEIVSAVILSLEESQAHNKEQVCDLILDLDEKELYPDMAEKAEVADTVVGQARTDAINTYIAEQLRAHPNLKISVGKEGRLILGLNKILAALREKFDLKQEEKIFRDYEEYARLARDKPKESMNDYILKSEALLRKLTKHKIELPDIVKAYNLLKGANLGKDETLARTSVDTMTFDSMKKTLLKMTDGVMASSNAGDSKVLPKVRVKEEVVLYQNERDEDFDYDQHYHEEEEDQEQYYEMEELDEDQNQLFFQSKQQSDHYNAARPKVMRGTNQYNHYRGGFRNKPARGNFRGSPRMGYSTTPVNNGNPDSRMNNHSNRRPNRYNSQCAICKSIFHWAKECPDKNKAAAPILKLDQDMVIDDGNLIYNAFADTVNLGIIDSGAAKTVCGKKWYEMYENSLTDAERSLIKEEEETNTSFRFGDGNEIRSNVAKLFPTRICGKDVIIRANIVDNDVPLLISKVTLKNAKANLDFDHDQLVMDGIAQDLVNLPSNHYAIPIGRQEKDLTAEESQDVMTNLISEVYFENEDPEKMAWQIHRYFAHASSDKLKQFVSNTNHPKKKEIIQQIDKLDCNLCKKHKREVPRPRVSLPMAERFNQTVALDLKFMDSGEVFVHVIDLLTRFSSVMLVRDKTKEEIVEKFFMMWISIFGRPEKTLCDNGKEFCNEDFVSMCTNLNINMKTTAAFAPWSNGMVERHNALIAEMVEKIQQETGCSTEIALCWAANAKNSMANVYGFSPQQLVFGYNTYCPGLDEDHISVSQIEGITSSKIVADNLNAMHEARAAFLMAQNSERLKRALKGRVYKAYETKYFIGDRVYYRTVDNEWKGPGIVIGQYKKLVLVKTGGLFVRVYPNRLVLKTDADKMLNTDKPSPYQGRDDETVCSGDEYEEQSRIVHDSEKRPEGNDISSDSEDSEVDANERENQNQDVSATAAIDESETSVDESEREAREWQDLVKDSKKDRYILKAGDEIRFKTSNVDTWSKAVVLGNAGTSKGVNKNRYNIQTNEGEQMSIFADRVEKLQRKPGSTILSIQGDEVYFAQNPDKDMLDKIESAKLEELKNFDHFQVYEEVQKSQISANATIISSRWIIQNKSDGRVKARIVARGFEEGEMSYVDAPTVKKSSLRTILTIANLKEWKCSSLDVKSAFLQSHRLDRNVYLNPPKDIRKKGVIWRIIKPIYGLKDSAKNWYNTLRSELIQLGCKESILDPTVFSFYQEDKLVGLFICHVDDFLYGGCGDSYFKRNVIDHIVTKYDISSSFDVSFKYIGLNIEQQSEGIKIDQKSFSQTVKAEKIENMSSRKVEELLDEKEKKLYQKLLGKINWLAHQSRPDLSFDAYNFSLVGQSPTVGDLKKLNKMITKINTGLEYIWLPKLNEQKLCILAFSDASLANILPEKTDSGEGYLIFLSDSYGNSCLINWISKKITRTVLIFEK